MYEGRQTVNLGVQPTELILLDVGGMRPERKKWIHTFDYIDIIIYLLPINIGYLIEEATNLWTSLAMSPFFETPRLLILFTKADILEKQLTNGKLVEGPLQDLNTPNVQEFVEQSQKR